MSDGRIVKPDRDFSKEVEKEVPEAQELAKTDVPAAIEKLLALEKLSRQASDLASTTRLLLAIVAICRSANDWRLLNEQVLQLSRKHGQLRQAITKMVQVVMGLLDETPDLDTRLSVIEMLRTVTEGKLFVEVERARVTRMLSDIKKRQGDIKGAAEIICELQVETFGSMERREKTEFILEQVSLCMHNGDWSQATVLSRKISPKYFASKGSMTKLEDELKERRAKAEKGEAVDAPEDVTDLKLRYYGQQIRQAKHEERYLDVAKHYQEVLQTPAVRIDDKRLPLTLRHMIYYVILAPYDNEQSHLMHLFHQDIKHSWVPLESRLLKLFTMTELIQWAHIESHYGPHLCASDVFDASAGTPDVGAGTGATGLGTDDGGDASSPHVESEERQKQRRWQDLRKRVIEHNVRVVARYYTRIRLPRLSSLLGLDPDESEKYLSALVTAGMVYARIDRPAGIVDFSPPSQPDDVLNGWRTDMKSLLGLLERIDHLITKEEMMGALEKAK